MLRLIKSICREIQEERVLSVLPLISEEFLHEIENGRLKSFTREDAEMIRRLKKFADSEDFLFDFLFNKEEVRKSVGSHTDSG